MSVSLLAAYRATGADLPFGDLLRAHPGVAMEGYFWRFTDVAAGRVAIALIGVNRDARGASWATVAVAAHPGGFLRAQAMPEGEADAARLGVRAGEAFDAGPDRLRVDLGADARLEVRLATVLPWGRRALGGSSVFQVVPNLAHYWHPWLLGGRAVGRAVLGGQVWDLDGAAVYAEKSWGRGGFPLAWWWGQAQGFDEPEACVAFAGGVIDPGPLRTEVTAIVVRLPGGRVIRIGDPLVSPVRAHVADERWLLSGRGALWGVEVEGMAPLGAALVLPVPLPAERRNVAGALEHLAGRLRVVVRRRGRVVWHGESSLAALEHGGIERARAEAGRRGAPDASAVPPLTADPSGPWSLPAPPTARPGA